MLRNSAKRVQTTPFRVSDRHTALLSGISEKQGWTKKLAAERAIERLAKDLGVLPPASDESAKPQRRKAAA